MRVFYIPALLDSGAWEYLDEGAANIILRHNEHRSLLLRIRKKPTSLLGFNYHVISQLIPPIYLGRFGLLEVHRTFLESVDEQFHGVRPEHRKSKGVNMDQWCAILLENFSVPITASIPENTSEECVTIEFKPKAALRGKYPVCKWCMQQHYKVAKGSRKAVGAFCPLDIYSDDPARIRKAVEALWWDDESSMKMYVNGYCTTRTQGSAFLINVIVHALVESPILGLLQSLQRRLDTVSLQTLQDLYLELEASHELHMGDPEAGTGPYWKDWITAIDSFLAESNSDEEEENLPQSLSAEEKRHIILRFLLATTLKDCSLMISMHKKKGSRCSDWFVDNEKEDKSLQRSHLPSKQTSFMDADLHVYGFDIPHQHTAPVTARQRLKSLIKTKSLSYVSATGARPDTLEEVFDYFNPSANLSPVPWIVHQSSGYSSRIKLIDLDPKSAHKIPTYFRDFQEIVKAYENSPMKKGKCGS